MKTPFKSLFALPVSMYMGTFIIIKKSRGAQSPDLQKSTGSGELLDLNQFLSYSTSMPVIASDYTFDA